LITNAKPVGGLPESGRPLPKLANSAQKCYYFPRIKLRTHYMEIIISLEDKPEEIVKFTADKLKQYQSDWWKNAEKIIHQDYGKLFDYRQNRFNIDLFLEFLDFKNNLHWKGIGRNKTEITQNRDKLGKTMLTLIDPGTSESKRISVFDKGSELFIPGLNKATITPILMIAFPDKYGVWNERSIKALTNLHLYSKFFTADKQSEKYRAINEILVNLSHKTGLSLWHLDCVLGHLAQTPKDGEIAINLAEGYDQNQEKVANCRKD